MQACLVSLGVGVVLAVGFAAVFVGALRLRAKNWMLLLLGLAPVAFLYVWNTNYRVFSYHGLWHTSIVYRIMAGNIPPDNPVLAGTRLLYPWAHHVVVGGLCSLLGVAPSFVFAALNVACLAATLWLAYKVASFLSGDRRVLTFAALLSAFGVCFLSAEPILRGVTRVTGVRLAHRHVPIVKFTTVNSFPLGMVCFLLFLWSFLCLIQERGPVWRACGLLLLSVIGAGLFYPFAWLVVLAGGSVCGIVLCAWRGRAALRKLALAASSAAAGSALVAPYIYYAASGKSAEGMLRPVSSFRVAALHVLSCGVALLPILLVLCAKRKVLRDVFRSRKDALVDLLVMAAVTGAMYLLIEAPGGTEYKFLCLCCMSLGPIGALGLAALCRRDTFASACVISLFLLPMGLSLAAKTPGRWQVTDEFREDGAYLRHADPTEHALYTWMAAETDPDAIFIDTKLTVPAFGRRALYVGLDVQREGGPGRYDGWFMSIKALLKALGCSAEVMDSRTEVATAFYSEHAPISDEAVVRLREAAGGRDVFVVARDAPSARKLAGDARFHRMFELGGTAAYKLLERTGAGG